MNSRRIIDKACVRNSTLYGHSESCKCGIHLSNDPPPQESSHCSRTCQSVCRDEMDGNERKDKLQIKNENSSKRQQFNEEKIILFYLISNVLP